MNNKILAINIFFLILVMINFFHNYKKSNIISKNLGKINVKWSSLLNLFEWESWLRIVIVFLGFILILNWIIFECDQNYGYGYIIALLLAMSSYHRWIVRFGTNGIMFKIKLLYWKDVKNLNVYKQKKITLVEIQFLNSSLNKIIKVPPKYTNELTQFLVKLKKEGTLKQYKSLENNKIE